MPDDAGQTQAAATGSTTNGVIVPLKMREQFPVIVELIMGSESMNDSERQYWLDLLPVMTPEQITQLQSILQNEKDQLAAIDAKYGKQIEDIATAKRPLEEIAQTRKAKSTERHVLEETARTQEERTAEDILKQVEEL
jgi:hypothetical protein